MYERMPVCDYYLPDGAFVAMYTRIQLGKRTGRIISLAQAININITSNWTSRRITLLVCQN